MTGTSSALRRVAVAAAIAALTAAGCSSTHTTPEKPSASTAGPTAFVPRYPTLPPGTSGTPPVPLPTSANVKNGDPDTVSQAAVTIQWTMDTTIDTSQHDAELRSADLLAPRYLAALKAHPPVAAPGAQWIEWSHHRAYTTVTTRALHDQRPPDTPLEARRQWLVTATPHGRDRWTGRPVTSTVFVTMTRADASSPWRVSAVTVSS
ncbi:hypothetical protein AB0K09_18260 [Streptomyces sp. NPDC049577]|uniref:hypothetical protein n=1 Tax=Streptomyces sp. NPDC049577 TaxID=3155153 RepID=UPI0034194346